VIGAARIGSGRIAWGGMKKPRFSNLPNPLLLPVSSNRRFSFPPIPDALGGRFYPTISGESQQQPRGEQRQGRFAEEH
jgi:hypothetical protein